MSRYTKQLEDTTIHQAAKLEALETDQGLMRKKVQLLEQLCAVQKDKEVGETMMSLIYLMKNFSSWKEVVFQKL